MPRHSSFHHWVLCFNFVGNPLISWKSKKQQTISRSSVEAEYLAITTCEIIWLCSLLVELQKSHPQPFCSMIIKSATYIANNLMFHERTKHIKLDCHFVWNRVVDGSIKLLLVWSLNQLADAFTKPLLASCLFLLMCKMGVQDIFATS